MRFFDRSDLTSECIIYHSNANSHLWIVRQPIHGNQTNIFGTRAAYIFPLKFYHQNANGTCFKYFTYSNKKKIKSEDAISELRRVYYIYTPNRTTTYAINNGELNWPLPDKYSTKVRISVRGFTFTFPNLSDFSKNLIESSQDAINKDTNTEQSSSAPTQNSFFPEQNVFEDSVKNSKNIPIKYYINKSASCTIEVNL